MKRIYPVRNKPPRGDCRHSDLLVGGRISNGIYFDYAATSPVDPAVERAMKPFFLERFGNPGSLHFFGQSAMAAVDEARAKIAKIIGADFREIIFTGSATEANNLALRGAVKFYQHKSVKISINQRPRLIISAIEHESILETARDLEKEGVETIYLPVDKNGLVNLGKLKKSLNERTVLVSIIFANNEIGTIQPIAEISKIISAFKERNFVSKKSVSEPERAWSRAKLEERGRESSGRASGWASETPSFRETRLSEWPLFHTDAVQAFQYLDCDVKKLGVDLMTLSGHKICGPKGIGVLYVRSQNSKPHTLSPIITGGGQEFGLRSGTENVPLIVGLAKAVELAVEKRENENKRIRELSNYFWQQLKKIYPVAELNNPSALISRNPCPPKPWRRREHQSALPNILNVYFPTQGGSASGRPGQPAQDLLIKLDLAGIAVSAGSACSARSTVDSHVLKALGLPLKRVRQSLRFSFGRFTTREEIKEAIKRIKRIF